MNEHLADSEGRAALTSDGWLCTEHSTGAWSWELKASRDEREAVHTISVDPDLASLIPGVADREKTAGWGLLADKVLPGWRDGVGR